MKISRINRSWVLPAAVVAGLAALAGSARAATYTLNTDIGNPNNWNTASIWGGPSGSNSYTLNPAGDPNDFQVLNGGVIRSNDLTTFEGHSLTLEPGGQIRFKFDTLTSPATINFNAAPAGINPIGLILNGGILDPGDNGTFILNGSLNVAANSILDLGNGAGLLVRVVDLEMSISGSNSLSLVGTNGSGNSYPTSYLMVGNNSGSAASTFSGTWNIQAYGLTTNGANVLGLSGGSTGLGVSTVSLSAGTTLDMSAIGNNQAIAALASPAGSGGTVNLGTNTLTINGPGTSSFSGVIQGAGGGLAMNAALVLSLAGNQTANYSISGTGSLTINGAGSLILIDTNTYSGSTTIGGGTLQLGTGAAGQDGSLLTSGMTNNGALVFNLAGSQTADYLISGTGSLTKLGTGALVLSNSNTYSGPTTIGGGTLQLGAGGAGQGAPATSGMTDNGAVVFNFAGSQTPGYGISGSGSLAKLGAGALILSNSNTYSGPTTIGGGTLQISGGGVLGGGNYTAAIADSGSLVFGASSSQTLGGPISGNGSLTMLPGAGLLVLSATNSFTGPTTIGGGTLQLGTGGAGQDGSLATSGMTNNGSLVFDAAGSQVAGYVISGSGSLKKVGNGNLVLSASNTYSGATSVSAGTLTINASPGNSGAISGTGAVTVAAGATLQVNGNTGVGGNLTSNINGILSLVDNTANTLTVAGTAGFATSTLYLELGSSGTAGAADEIVIKGSAKLTGISEINLSSIPGQSVLSKTYTLVSAAGGLTASGNNKFQLGQTPPSFDSFTLTSVATAVKLVVSGNATPATAYWTGLASQNNGDTANQWAFGAGLSTQASNWSTTVNGLSDPLQVPGPITNVIFTATNASASGGSLSTQLDASYGINGLTFGVSAGTIASVAVNANGNLLTIGSGGLTLTGTASASAAINGSGGVVVNGSQAWANNSNSQSLTVSTPITAQSGATTLTLSGTGSGGITLSGQLADGGGTLSLSANQKGVTVLAGTNTYSGGTTIGAGTLNINSDAALGTAPATSATNVSFANNATLQFAAPANLAATRGVSIGGGVTATLDTHGNSVSIGGPITGGGNLIQVGPGGTLILTNSNTYTGSTTVSAGTLQLGSGASGQDGSLTTSGVTDNTALVYNLHGAQTAGYGIGGPGSLTMLGVGTLVLGGTNSYGGGTSVNGGVLDAQTTAALPNFSSGAVSVASGGALAVQVLAGSATNGWTDANITSLVGNSNVTFAAGSALGIDVVAGGSYTPSINLAVNGGGTNGLVKLGGGTLILTAPATFSGTATISAGTLQLGNGASGNDGSLATASIVDNASLVYNLFAGQTYSGTISGTGSVTTFGTSTLTLSGNNTYTGLTTVAGGTLAVNGSLNSSGSVTVAGGGTLVGAGSAGNVTVASGGVIDVSQNSGPRLSLSSLTLGQNPADAATLDFSAGTNQNLPQLAIGAGGLTPNGGSASVTINVGGSVALTGTYTLATLSGSLSGAGSSAFVLGSQSGLVGRQDGKLLITANAIDWVVGLYHPIWSGANGSLWSGTNNWARSDNGGPTTFITGDAVVFDDSAGTAGHTTNVTISGSNVSPGSVAFNNNAYNYTVSGPMGIAGTGSLTLNGTGSVTLSTSNTYNGGTNINHGTLIANNTSGAATGGGPVSINGGTLQIGNGGAAGMLSPGPISDNSVLAFARSDSGLVFANTIVGSGAVVEIGPGLTTFTATNNSYGGGTRVTGGVLEVTTTAVLPNFSSGTVTVGSGAALAVQVRSGSATNGWTDANIASLLGDSHATFAAGSALGIDVVAGGNYTPSINLPLNTLGLLKLGAGIMNLTGTNNYSGGTTVTGGELNLDSNTAILPGSSLIIGDPAVLGPGEVGAVDVAASPEVVSATTAAATAAVPEPGSLGLLIAAAGAVAAYVRRRRSRIAK